MAVHHQVSTAFLSFKFINNANAIHNSVVCLIATLWITNQVKSEFVSRRMIILFSITYPFYLVLSATIGLYGHARQIVKYSSWNPTARN